MTTEQLLERLVTRGEVKFWLTPSRTRIGIEFTPARGDEPIGRFGSDLADIQRPLQSIYDAYTARVAARVG